MTREEQPPTPRLQVVRGDASPEDIAAVLAVLSAAGEPEAPPAPVRSRWGRPQMRIGVRASQDGWLRSGRPG
ncbi:acyl-CoA carboxylase epsilon subunit [Luteipulveratus sp. YIM 133132]|uniref:acyl-CoA carboxylase epsilon subunit n=1 Tax=Luteipulveratus flavus TaxID=3031728 RepID=UPI0023B1B828|nr:acyl-CoA carboxylase epsilon subunit [Luteipulveratus sp. YIM 133132]MDE9367011.1 acyl-CoA carboxylase epsilon subunit [Luteipulveratus sp. YIM 133132]